MNRKLTSGTRKHILWVSLIMLLLFVSLIILQWWVMALGLLLITMTNLIKELGNPTEEKWTHNSGNFSDRVRNKSAGELPIDIVGTSIVAVTYDDSGKGVDIIPITIKPTTEVIPTAAR